MIIATFADDGPMTSTGLNVERYDLDKLHETLGDNFELVRSFRERHKTPSDAIQTFLYAHFRKSVSG